MTRFAALGDSVTLGLGDPVRGRGWAAFLAESLPGAELHMLAANGAGIAEIERDQLPRALAVRPQVASVVFGINDTFRPGRDLRRISASADHTIGALRAAGAQVLTMRLPDAGRMLGLPGPLARPLARRTHEVNEVLDTMAARFGTLHLDVAGLAQAYDRDLWAADRIHPNERGHRLLARSFHRLLAEAGVPVGQPAGAEPDSRPPGLMAELAWLATKGTTWVLRRCVDLLPYLLAMAARDVLDRRPPAHRSISEVADARVGAGVAVEPVSQRAGGLHVAPVVGEQPVPGCRVAVEHRPVVGQHGLLAAGIGHDPGEPGQRRHVLQPGPATRDHLTLENLSQVDPVDVRRQASGGGQPAHLGDLCGRVIAVRAERGQGGQPPQEPAEQGGLGFGRERIPVRERAVLAADERPPQVHALFGALQVDVDLDGGARDANPGHPTAPVDRRGP